MRGASQDVRVAPNGRSFASQFRHAFMSVAELLRFSQQIMDCAPCSRHLHFGYLGLRCPPQTAILSLICCAVYLGDSGGTRHTTKGPHDPKSFM